VSNPKGLELERGKVMSLKGGTIMAAVRYFSEVLKGKLIFHKILGSTSQRGGVSRCLDILEGGSGDSGTILDRVQGPGKKRVL